MNWMLAGFAFGFLGSVHCVGMCGPLALSLPGKDAFPWRYVAERVLYNIGRALTYALLGALVGALGSAIAWAGFQRGLSIGIGALMVLTVAVPWVQQRLSRVEQAPSAFLRRVMGPIQSLYKRGGFSAMLIIGLLNGLLPCGFVYAALATALTAGSMGESALFMAAFGLGTFPAMLAVSAMGRIAGAPWRNRLYRWAPYAVVFVGLLLIWRGLALGLPLSPAGTMPA